MVWGSGALGLMGEARPIGSRYRRNVLVGLLAVLLVVAAVWGSSFRDAADLAAIEAAIADHDWPRAESLLDAAPPSDPPPTDSRQRQAAAQRQFLLGRVARRQRRFSEAERCFDAAEQLGLSSRDINRQRLLQRAQSGEVMAVEDEIGRMLAEGGDDTFAEDCYEALAEGFITAYRMPDAQRCLDYWSQWQPRNPLPSYWKGMIETRYERPVFALEHFASALALNPRFYDARIRLAKLELDTARIDDAQRHFGECLTDRPDDPAATIGLADCLLRAGDFAAARSLYHDALATDLSGEQASGALVELGQMALEEGDVGRAAALLSQAVAVDPRGTRARLMLAGALLRAGDEEGATRQREIANRFAEKQRRLAVITHDALGKPDDPDLRAEVGAILIDEGFVAEGLQWVEMALGIDPDHHPSHRVLADYYTALGEGERAAHHLALAKGAPRPGPVAAPRAAAEIPGGAKDGPTP